MLSRTLDELLTNGLNPHPTPRAFVASQPKGPSAPRQPTQLKILEAGIALERKTLELDSALKYTSNPPPLPCYMEAYAQKTPAPRAPFGIGLPVDSTQFTHTCLHDDTIGRYRKIEAGVKY